MFSKFLLLSGKPTTHGHRTTAAFILAGAVFANVVVAAPAHAQDHATVLPPASPTRPFGSIAPAQAAEFAELLGEPAEDVKRHLLWDPGLAPLAAAAADARVARQRTGRNLTIGGFTLLGAGVTAGFLVAMQGLCFGESADCKARDAESSRNGEIVMLVSVGIGLLVAVPGIIMMARRSHVESQAVDRYRIPQIERAAIFTPDSRPLR